MERYTLALVAPIKLKGLKAELESINNYCGKPVFLKVEHEINDLNQLENYVNSGTKSEFLLIFESLIESRVNLEKAQEELLEKLRKARFSDAYSKIIVILQSQKENEGLFINELIKLDIQDFFFVNDFSKDDIAGWLFSESRTLKDNLKYLSTNISKPEVVIKEVPKYIEVPVSYEEKAIKTPLFSKESGKVVTQGEQRESSYIIGIIGTSPGTGATSLCISYAAYLKEHKKKVLLLDRTDNKHLSSIEIKGQDINSCFLYNVDIQTYDFILIDFGSLADIQDLEVILKPDLTNEKRMERSFCKDIILVGSTLPWKLNEICTYTENPVFEKLTQSWIFYLTGEKNEPFNSLRKTLEQKRVILTSYDSDNPVADLDRNLRERRT